MSVLPFKTNILSGASSGIGSTGGGLLTGNLSGALSASPIGIAGSLITGISSIIPGMSGFLSTGSLSCLGNQAMDDKEKQKAMSDIDTWLSKGHYPSIAERVAQWQTELPGLRSECSKRNFQAVIDYGNQKLSQVGYNSGTTNTQTSVNNSPLAPLQNIFNVLSSGAKSVLQNQIQTYANETSMPVNDATDYISGLIGNGSIRIDENGNIIWGINATNAKQPEWIQYAIIGGLGLLAYKVFIK